MKSHAAKIQLQQFCTSQPVYTCRSSQSFPGACLNNNIITKTRNKQVEDLMNTCNKTSVWMYWMYCYTLFNFISSKNLKPSLAVEGLACLTYICQSQGIKKLSKRYVLCYFYACLRKYRCLQQTFQLQPSLMPVMLIKLTDDLLSMQWKVCSLCLKK